MDHCVWTPNYKTYYEKIVGPSGHIEFIPLKSEQGINRDWCEPCKKAVESWEVEYRAVAMAYDWHIKMNHGHCFECENCEPYVRDRKLDVPLCQPERCEICFKVPPTCIEKSACPANDIINQK